MNSQPKVKDPAPSERHLRTVETEETSEGPVPRTPAADTYLVDSEGSARKAEIDPETKPMASNGKMLMYIGIAVAILAVVALIGMA